MTTIPEFIENNIIGREIAHDARLNSTEIGELWNTYMSYSMYTCVYKHFLSNVQDKDIRSVLEFAMDIANKRVTWVMETFNKEGLPIPIGFTDEDVNIKAPRLYSDPFYLHYIKNKTNVGIVIEGLALTSSARPDVREFYAHCCSSTTQLYQRTADLLLSKGIYIRPPYITTIKTTDTVKKQNFLAGYLVDKRRPLLATEISSLFQGITSYSFGKGILISFRQVARSKQVRDYMERGIDLANSFVNMFTPILSQEDIPIPMVWDTFVTDSTVPPFSDKLMMGKSLYMSAAGIVNCGTAISTNLRHDLLPGYTRTMTDVGNYAEDGVNIMIENGWLEEPPRVVDRKNLINAKQ